MPGTIPAGIVGLIPAGIVGLIPHLQSAGLVPALVPRPEWANGTGPYRYSQLKYNRRTCASK